MRRTFLFVPILGVSLIAAADQPFDIRPGLWNLITTLDAGSGTDTISSSSCITAEDVRSARLLQVAMDPRRSCKSQVTRQTSSTLEGVIECPAASGISRTRVSFAASSPTRLVGTMQTTGADLPHEVKIAISAEWSSAVCPVTEEDASEADQD